MCTPRLGAVAHLAVGTGSAPAGRNHQRRPRVARISIASFIASLFPWHSYGPAENGK
jgi:hypothetical protein